MAIERMLKLRLMAVKSQEEELMQRLQLLGCVQVNSPDSVLADEELSQLVTTDPGELATLRDRYARLQEGIALLDRYAPAKKKLTEPRPLVHTDTLFDEEKLSDALELADRIGYFDDQIRRVGVEEGRLRSEIETLSPWAELDLPLEFTGTETCDLILGGVPTGTDMTSLRSQLTEAAEASELLQIGEGAELIYLVLICRKGQREQALSALRSFGFSISSFPDGTGKAASGIARDKASLEELEIGRAGLEDMIRAESVRREELQLCSDTVAVKIERAEAAEKVLRTDYTLSLEGWVPEERAEDLKKVLDEFDCGYELEQPSQEEYPEVPVKLKNNILTRPLNMVTDMYSLPAYDGIDPNPIMAPFFILFYGLMMADMGYGIMMILLGVFLLKGMHARGTMKHMGGLFVLCGITTFIVGAMTGSFFGDFIPQIAKLINPNTTLTALPALFTSLTDTIAILIGSLILGFLQIITGMIVSVVYKIKNGEFIDALFNEITWWIILGGAAMAIFKVGSVNGIPVVLIIGILMLAIGGTRNAKGFGKVSSFIGLVYNGVSGFFSDTLSYARIMALMLAGSVIAQVFNTLGSVTGNVIGFIIISMIGNILNFLLNILGCYVHDLRLQCLEFFGRFYKEGGKAFTPLEVSTQYMDITENI